MGTPAFYTMDDPLARLNVMTCRTGEVPNRPFDRSEFTTTILLQAPDAGGLFAYRTDPRTDEDPNHDGVAKLLAGLNPDMQRLKLAAGGLNVFRDKHTAHRLTPVQGRPIG